jgi:hypothetical protein
MALPISSVHYVLIRVCHSIHTIEYLLLVEYSLQHKAAPHQGTLA